MKVDGFKHRQLAPTVVRSSRSLGELEGPHLQNQSTRRRPIKTHCACLQIKVDSFFVHAREEFVELNSGVEHRDRGRH
jgi:hypothetical protein